eukprot:Phypoly_transcript_26097.p2 GENE.Phypoly_transcript_26097~~Phypoly_transcript_26097.p2  ORF type:complete len:109 (+),score=15.37 Phypoly_transcript_26097:109-435(+)
MSFSFHIGIGFKPEESGRRDPEHGEIALYEHDHYGGKVHFTKSHITNLNEVGLNDKISSVRVGDHNTHAILYEHSNYGGKTLKVDRDIPNLKDHGFNDIASSVEVHHH